MAVAAMMRSGWENVYPVFQSPLEHDVFSDRKDPRVKHGPHFLREPVIKRDAPVRISHQLDAKSNFRERYRANVKLVERLPRIKATTFGSGLGRRNSDNTLVSSNHAIRTQCRGSAGACGQVQDSLLYRGKPPLRQPERRPYPAWPTRYRESRTHPRELCQAPSAEACRRRHPLPEPQQ